MNAVRWCGACVLMSMRPSTTRAVYAMRLDSEHENASDVSIESELISCAL